MGKLLTKESATRLTANLSLQAHNSPFRVRARVERNETDDGHSIVFELGRTRRSWDYRGGAEDTFEVASAHSLAVEVSCRERVLAHWHGFCSNHGFEVNVGDHVQAGAPDAHWRVHDATVTHVTDKSVTVRGTYAKDGRTFTYTTTKAAVSIERRVVD